MTSNLDVAVFSANYVQKYLEKATNLPARKMPDGKTGICYKAWVYPVHRINGDNNSLRIYLDNKRVGKKSCPVAPEGEDLVFVDDISTDSAGGYVVTNNLEWHEGNLEDMVSNPINPGAIKCCPICKMNRTAGSLPEHYIQHLVDHDIQHLNDHDKEKFMKLIVDYFNKFTELAQREPQSLGEIAGIQIRKRTQKQLLNDLKNEGRKGALPDAKAAPSTVRKIDRNKRRK
jgi:hypothetical protein